jgi:hypothetical protein
MGHEPVETLEFGGDPESASAKAMIVQNGERLSAEAAERFSEHLLALLQDRDIKMLTVQPFRYGPLEIKSDIDPPHEIQNARFDHPRGSPIHIRKLRFGNVQGRGDGDLVIKDCFMRELSVDGGARLELIDTWIVDLKVGRLRELSIRGGGVYRPTLLSTEADAPNATYVIGDDVQFPIRAPKGVAVGDGLPFGDPAPFRNLRRHLATHGNNSTVLRFIGLVREREAQMGRWPRRVVGKIYQLVAGYGVSWTRPLLWWLGLVVLTGGILGWTNSAELSVSAESLRGWQRELLVDHPFAPWLRGFWLAITSAINPGQWFDANVEPATFGAAIFLSVYFCISGVLIYLLAKAAKLHFVET